MFPEELMLLIVDYLADSAVITFHDPQLPFLPKYSTESLHPLSLVDRRWRRVCLPVLFAYVWTEHLKGIEQLHEQCITSPRLASSIKVLEIRDRGCCEQSSVDDALYSLLPHLGRLARLELSSLGEGSHLLLEAVRQRSQAVVSLALFHGRFPRRFLDSAPKVVMKSLFITKDADIETLESRVALGMRVWCLEIGCTMAPIRPPGIDFDTGLRQMVFTSKRSHQDISTWTEFALSQPSLEKMVFGHQVVLTPLSRPTVPYFVLSFLEEAEKRMNNRIVIRRFSVSRNAPELSTPPSRRPFDQWHVTGLYLSTGNNTFRRVLKVVKATLPRITALTLSSADFCHIDKFIALIRPLRHLRHLGILQPMYRVHFGNEKPWRTSDMMESPLHPKLSPTKIGPVETEAALIWFTSRISQAVPSLEAFYVEESGCDGFGGGGAQWNVKGWLNVARRGVTEGQLKFSPPTRRPGGKLSEHCFTRTVEISPIYV